MNQRMFPPVFRLAAIGLALLAAVVWLQRLRLDDGLHEQALLALMLLGLLAFWMAQGRRR